MTSTVITGAHIFDPRRPFEQADVLIVDGAIQAVEPNLAGRGDRAIDARGMILIPGLINAHTHSDQTIARGLADRLSPESWMVLTSNGGPGARLGPHDLYTSAVHGIIEMLKSGTTSVVDCATVERDWIHEGLDGICQAYVDTGMRGVVASQFADLGLLSSIPIELPHDVSIESRQPIPTSRITTELGDFLDRWQGAHPLVEPALAPWSLPQCSDALFTAVIELAQARGVQLQTHLLPAKSQVLIARDRFHGSTVGHLRDLGALESSVSLANGTWVSDEELAILAGSKAVIVHSPVSDLKLGAGVAPAPAMYRAGVTIALGTDGASSNGSQNMFDTIKSAALVHRLHGASSEWPSALEVLEWCWRGGAHVMGKAVGRIEVGHRADLALLQPGTLSLAPKDVIAQQLVFGEFGNSVHTVIVDGDVVVEEGVVTQVDELVIRERAQILSDRLWADLDERLDRLSALREGLNRLERDMAIIEVGFQRP